MDISSLFQGVSTARCRQGFRLVAIFAAILIPWSSAFAWEAGASSTETQEEKAGLAWDVTKPRGKTRAIEFRTSKGTSMTVDPSSNGKWIVFDLLGHIYRIPADGGKAEVLTGDGGISLNYQPAFSPDGSQIAFISDRSGNHRLWIMDASGLNPRPVSDGKICVFEPAWTPDGKSIVVRKQANCHRGLDYAEGLWLFDVDSGTGRKFIKGRAGSPAVSPDGEFVYFHIATCPGYPPGHNDVLKGCHQVWRKHIGGGFIETVTPGTGISIWENVSGGGGIAPELSPNGRYLAFARRISDGLLNYRGHLFGPRNALWIRDLKNGKESVVMDPIDIDGAEQSPYASPLLPGYGWTADSTSIVLSQGGKIRRVSVDTGTVHTVPFEAIVRREISELVKHKSDLSGDRFSSQFIRSPTLFPVDERLLFQAAGRLWTRAGSGSVPNPLISSSSLLQYTPSLSPDGKKVAFSGWSDSGDGAIWEVESSGGVPRRITPVGEYLYPVWTDDGSLIAIKGGGASLRGRPLAENSRYELTRIDVDTGAEVTLAHLSGNVLNHPAFLRPSVGTDGRVFYLSDAGPEFLVNDQARKRIELRSVAWNGADPATHGVVNGPGEVTVSPNGEFVAFTRSYQVWIRRMPDSGTGDSAPIIDALDSSTRVDVHGGHSIHWRDVNRLEFSDGENLQIYDVRTGTYAGYFIGLQLARTHATGELALVGAEIITVGKSGVLESGAVIVRNGKIACVGDCDITQASKVIDVHGKTIIPGIVDTHAHYNSSYGGFIPRKDSESAAYLAFGITTLQDPAPEPYDIHTRRELAEAGQIIGPRIFTTGRRLHSGDGFDYADAESVLEAVTQRKNWGAVSIKAFDLPRRDQRQWAAQAANFQRANITSEGANLPLGISLAMDGYTGIEHTMVSGVPILYRDVVRFLAKSGTTLSLTVSVTGPGPMAGEFYIQEDEIWRNEKLRQWIPWRNLLPLHRRSIKRPSSDYGFPLLAESVSDLIRGGASVSMGGHGDVTGLSTHWELWLLAAALDPMSVLEVGTLNGAKYIGIDEHVGSIVEGKIADLLILNSSPLDDIRATADIAYVMKSGILFDATQLDEIWPEKRPYGPRPWQDDDALRSDTLEFPSGH